MKAFTSSLACSAFLLMTAALVCAAPEPTRAASRPTSDAPWNVRVEVLMVAMPQDKLLPLLPDLRDPKKIDGAVDQLLAAVQRKEAVLTGYPVVNTLDGQRSVSETTAEKRYPTEFDLPQQSPQKDAPAPKPAADGGPVDEFSVPTAFETRNCGVTLEVEPHVSTRGESVRLLVVAQRVELLGFDSFGAGKAASGKVFTIDQPQFFDTKANTTLSAPNGQHTLIAVHLLSKPENYMEVFILQATATPTK